MFCIKINVTLNLQYIITHTLKKTLFLLYTILTVTISYAQLIVTNENDGLALAQSLVGNGVSISNVTFVAANNSCGKFINVQSAIQLETGIVLTSGKAKTQGTVVGVNGNSGLAASTDNNTAGDASLNMLLSGGINTEDAAVLEFDFVPLGETISFNYVFSSEEYPLYVCSNFNDVFGFFISGPGFATPKNIALIPNSNLPVTINNINSGTPGVGYSINNCNGGNPFTQYFINNNINNPFLTHNGLTVKLKASAAVTPCQTYHLKIAIADAGDADFDSGVFIEANSLNSNAVTINILGDADATTSTNYIAEGCNTGVFKIERRIGLSSSVTIPLLIGGTATNGVDYTTIPSSVTFAPNQSEVTIPITAFSDNITEGIETLKIYLPSGCNNTIYADSAVIEIRDYSKLNIQPAFAYKCATNNTGVLLNASPFYNTYTWDANSTLNTLNTPTVTATPTTDSTKYYCTAVLGTCIARDSALIVFNSLKVKSVTNLACNNNNQGSISVSHGAGWNMPLIFTINGGSPQPDSTFTNLGVGNYAITITDASGCTATVTATVAIAYTPLTITTTVLAPYCGNAGTITVTPSGGNPPYFYSTDNVIYQVSNVLPITSLNPVTLYVRDNSACQITQLTTITPIPTFTFTTITTHATCSGQPNGTITITAQGGVPPYLYSADGGTTFQTNNVLLVTSGVKNIVLKDFSNCNSATTQITVGLNNTTQVTIPNTPAPICESKSATLQATSNGTYNYQWLPSIAIQNSNTLSPTVSPTTTTRYYITATNGICTKTDSVLVTVNPAPIVVTTSDTTICTNGIANLTATGGTTYTWLPNYRIVGINSQSPTTTPLITTNYTVHTTDALGCKSLLPDTATITVIPTITVYAGNDTIVAPNQPIQLSAISNAPNYIWLPSIYLNNNNLANPVATFTQVGEYLLNVKAFTNIGCSASDVVKITVFAGPSIYIPTAFTPNGDGSNDVLKITAVGLQKFNYLKIYNRWGQLLFNITNPNLTWNGTLQSQPQPSGTYVYVASAIDYNGKPLLLKGTVQLMR